MLCVCIAVEGCHPEKKGSLAYTSTKLCCISTILNDQEIVKLSRNVMIPPSPREVLYSGREAGNEPTSAPSAEAAECHRKTVLPARKHPLQSGTKLRCPLIHTQEISTMRATFLSVNKWSQKSSESSSQWKNSFQVCCEARPSQRWSLFWTRPPSRHYA